MENPWKIFYESAKIAFNVSSWGLHRLPTRYFIRELTRDYGLMEPMDGGRSHVLSKGKVTKAAKRLHKYRSKIKPYTLLPSPTEEAAFVYLYPHATWDESGEYIELVSDSRITQNS